MTDSETTISRKQIRALRREAAQAGDTETVRLCDVALDDEHTDAERAAALRPLAEQILDTSERASAG